jgi:hypothetical protein
MRLHEACIHCTCCPVQAGEALAPERVDVEVVDTLPCSCKAALLPLVMGSETGVDRSLKCIPQSSSKGSMSFLTTSRFVNMSKYECLLSTKDMIRIYKVCDLEEGPTMHRR